MPWKPKFIDPEDLEIVDRPKEGIKAPLPQVVKAPPNSSQTRSTKTMDVTPANVKVPAPEAPTSASKEMSLTTGQHVENDTSNMSADADCETFTIPIVQNDSAEKVEGQATDIHDNTENFTYQVGMDNNVVSSVTFSADITFGTDSVCNVNGTNAALTDDATQPADVTQGTGVAFTAQTNDEAEVSQGVTVSAESNATDTAKDVSGETQNTKENISADDPPKLSKEGSVSTEKETACEVQEGDGTDKKTLPTIVPQNLLKSQAESSKLSQPVTKFPSDVIRRRSADETPQQSDVPATSTQVETSGTQASATGSQVLATSTDVIVPDTQVSVPLIQVSDSATEGVTATAEVSTTATGASDDGYQVSATGTEVSLPNTQSPIVVTEVSTTSNQASSTTALVKVSGTGGDTTATQVSTSGSQGSVNGNQASTTPAAVSTSGVPISATDTPVAATSTEVSASGKKVSVMPTNEHSREGVPPDSEASKVVRSRPASTCIEIQLSTPSQPRLEDQLADYQPPKQYVKREDKQSRASPALLITDTRKDQPSTPRMSQERDNDTSAEYSVEPSKPFKSLKQTWGTPAGDSDNYCKVCNKRVYEMEKIYENNAAYHKTCFRCSHCNSVLRLGNFAAMDGALYCKPHFISIFKTKGNYDEGFGKEKHSKQWTNKDTPTREAGPKEVTLTENNLNEESTS